MNIPVILIHRGNQDYLSQTISVALKFNPEVILLGDDQNVSISGKHDLISKYSSLSNFFSTIYSHLSTNPYEAELICFQRWFILEEFMEKNNIEICFYMDSDVFLCSNITTEFKKFDQFDFTLSHRCCGSNSFFKKNGLKDFCDFLLKIYKDKTSYEFEKLSNFFMVRQKHKLPGGVCDMTLLEAYEYKKCGSIGEMMYIIDNSTYDHNINTPDQGFEMFNGMKNIQIIDGLPFCKIGEKNIRFNTLHFQGPAKNSMKNFYERILTK